jgi:hypothetical protein
MLVSSRSLVHVALDKADQARLSFRTAFRTPCYGVAPLSAIDLLLDQAFLDQGVTPALAETPIALVLLAA